MPLDWVPPEEFLRHEHIVVFHVYKDDDFQAGTRDNWYTLSSTGTDNDGMGPSTGVFDVRNLPLEVPDGYRVDEGEHERIIKFHIDNHFFDEWERDEIDPPSAAEDGFTYTKTQDQQLGDDDTAWGVYRTCTEDGESHTELFAIVSTETAADKFIEDQINEGIRIPVALADSIHQYLISCTHGANFDEWDHPEPGVDECRQIGQLLDAYKRH